METGVVIEVTLLPYEYLSIERINTGRVLPVYSESLKVLAPVVFTHGVTIVTVLEQQTITADIRNRLLFNFTNPFLRLCIYTEG